MMSISSLENLVAPYAGAWIETSFRRCEQFDTVQSHPTRVRGLKHFGGARGRIQYEVAPYAGAWIETL